MKTTEVLLRSWTGRKQRMTVSSVGDMGSRVFSYTVGGAIVITDFGDKNLAVFIKT